MKCCPKCGSTNINFPVLYHPSIWKCPDCGYEGAFIIEDGELAEKLQELYRRRCNIIDWTKVKHCVNSWDSSADNWSKL